jgi:hypothetical protein
VGIQCVIALFHLLNLTPSVIMHIMSFVTLCEAYMGIDHDFDLWNQFFHAWRPQDSDMKLAILGAAWFSS